MTAEAGNYTWSLDQNYIRRYSLTREEKEARETALTMEKWNAKENGKEPEEEAQDAVLVEEDPTASVDLWSDEDALWDHEADKWINPKKNKVTRDLAKIAETEQLFWHEDEPEVGWFTQKEIEAFKLAKFAEQDRQQKEIEAVDVYLALEKDREKQDHKKTRDLWKKGVQKKRRQEKRSKKQKLIERVLKAAWGV